MTFDVGEVEAFREGTVGWVAAAQTCCSRMVRDAPLRFTAVLHLDRGVGACPVPLLEGVENEETLGFEMTTTVEHLAAAVQDERPDLTATAATDGTITIAFSDIEQSTEIAVRLGDHKWLELLRWHDDVVADRTAREGGHIVKSLGDGHMLAFPSASRARSAMEIQRIPRAARRRIRPGPHRVAHRRSAPQGRRLLRPRRHHGRAAAQARGNEILVSSPVRDLTHTVGTFEFGEPRTAELKGLPGRHQLFPLVWQGAV